MSRFVLQDQMLSMTLTAVSSVLYSSTAVRLSHMCVRYGILQLKCIA